MTEFYDPETAIDVSSLADYLGIEDNYVDYYQPPIPPKGLVQLLKAHPQHGSLPSFKANLLLKFLNENALISRKTLFRVAVDYSTMGNGYFQLIKNKNGVIVGTKHLPAINMRRKKNNKFCWLNSDRTITHFKDNEVFHLLDYDPEQAIYGVPYWYGALQSILLGEDSRLFPRKYFKNGAHTGGIIVTSGLEEKEKKIFNEVLKGSKGEGNFKTVNVNFPSGVDVDKMIKRLKLSEDEAKIDFTKFMAMSATDVLEAWRIRPEIVGMMPENTGGTGDLDKIQDLNYQNEVIPFQQEFMQLNEVLPSNHQLSFFDKVNVA